MLQGTAIEATMWREVADKYHPLLEEGKVYFFSRGKVKPANKNYSAVRNDYTISFDSQCAPVWACTPQKWHCIHA